MIKKILIAILTVILLIIFSFAGLYFYYSSSVNEKIEILSDTSFSIEKGSSVEKIGNQLEKMGLIKDTNVLKAFLYLNSDKPLQSGFYKIPKGSISMPELVDMLQKGSLESKLTFIEGWRKEEYIDYLRKSMGDDFATKFGSSEYIKEGYLFPDTYVIPFDYKPEDLASWMRNNFENKAKKGDWEQKAFEKGFTLEEVIILSSILEREMHIEKDRPIVAGILVKRLQNGWPLQVDATLQYAKGNSFDWWPSALRSDFKGLNSPYNTYLNKGLPPAPISNPGASAVESILNYKETNFWFYITGNDGITYYAETLDQHNKNVADHIK
jgi:UPF0755 protein